MIDPETRDYITSVKCIGSAGECFPPMFLISGVNILYKWGQYNNLDGDVVIDIMETSYVNNNTVLKQLQHFINHTQNKKRDVWLLFIIDNYGSYMIIPFYNLAIENKVVLFHLLPHVTYLTQLLDVEVFQLFKHYHTNTIDKAIWLGDEKFGKLEFLVIF